MKKEFCMMAIGLLLAGCSADEEIANVQTSETNAISFNVVSNNPQTKAMIINNNNFATHTFEVFAFKDGEHFMGRHEAGSWKSDGVEIKYQNNGWTYKNPEDMLYWPHISPLDFYAISPSDNLGITYPTIQSGSKTFTYTVNDEYGDQSYPENVDVMYAVATNQKKADLTNGVVTLHFKHALSQVVFQATKKDEQMQVQIQKMELFTLPVMGTFTFPTTASEDGSWAYDLLAATPLTIGLDLNGEGYIDVDHVSNPISLSMNKPVLVIPATLNAWQPEQHLISQAYGYGESYLKITCKIWQSTETNKDYFVGNASKYGVIYVPFGADWKQGKRYVYTLRFGAGYDENGKEYDIVPITFNADVEDWSEAPVIKDDF